ncbi:MAG: polysaccharide biosynthesis/export family protein [Prosthecobacter sp.]
MNPTSQRDPLSSFGQSFLPILLALTTLLFGACHSGRNSLPDIEAQRTSRFGSGIGSRGYQTGVGDALDVYVLEDSSFNGLYVVRPSGDIIIPKAGRIQVVNMTLEQVESIVRKVLEVNQLTKATVIVDPIRRGPAEGDTAGVAGLTVYLSGSVMKTGRSVVPYVGNGRVSAYQAITDAGGFAAFANKRRSYVLRRNPDGRSQRIPLDFVAIERGEGTDLTLQDGDTIVVPQKIFGF